MIVTVTLNAAVDKRYVVEKLQPHTVMRVKNVAATAGGKGLNVSRVAALLGESVLAMGLVGGCNGQLFESLITQHNITPAFTRINAETRTCINLWDEETEKSTELLEPGNPVTKIEWENFQKKFQEALPSCSCVVLSGSLPAGVPDDAYSILIQAARREGKMVFLDTSGDALKRALPACPDFIKPNTDEIKQITGKPVDLEDQLLAARELQARGIPYVALSLGKDGVLVVCREGIYRGSTPDIPVVNTVGCGDSMVAGFAVAFSRNQSMEQSIGQAVAVSTANALTQETGSFRMEDYQRLLTQVQVEKIN